MSVTITVCPSCGSRQIKNVKKDWIGEFHGETYTVPALEFYDCPDCGEKVYDRQAMQTIEAYSPAFARTRSTKKNTSKPSKTGMFAQPPKT